MTRLFLATIATLAVAAAATLADDPKPGAPKPSGSPAGSGKILTNHQTYHPAGTAGGRVVSVSAAENGGSITVHVPQIEADRVSASGRLYLKKVDRDTEFELAEDVKVFAWAAGDRPLKSAREPDGFRVTGERVGEVGIAFVPAAKGGLNLSGGVWHEVTVSVAAAAASAPSSSSGGGGGHGY